MSFQEKLISTASGITLLAVLAIAIGSTHTVWGASFTPHSLEGLWAPSPTAAPNNPSALPPEDRLLLAFYYPWYHVSTWSDPQMLDTPLFKYDSGDERAIAIHIAWAQQAALDGFIVSWWGKDDQYAFLDQNLDKVLDQMEMLETDLRATIYFETYSPQLRESQADILNGLKYVLDTYSAHPNFLTHDGRPVVFIYAVISVPLEGSASPLQAWQMIVDQLRVDGYDPFLIGEILDPLYLQVFDGLHTYFPLKDTAFYQNISCQAHNAGRFWVADIFPGYDDRLVIPPRPVPRYIPRADGKWYAATFDAAIQSDPDWIVLTSFNEWFENTHIEPSVLYGYDYIYHTAHLANLFRAWNTLSTVYVDATHTGTQDGSLSNPFNSLSEALIAASDGATLHVAGGVYDGPINLTRSVTLKGGYEPNDWTRDPAANSTIIQGDGNGPVVRVHSPYCLSTPSPMVELDGFTITGGAATGIYSSGGGVYAEDVSLLLVNDAIIDNEAQQKGGGVFVAGDSQLTIQQTRILSNTALTGGGVYAEDQSHLELTNVLIAHNQAAIGGGGLYLGPDVSASIVNSTLTANDAPGHGKGLHVFPFASQSVAITNSILWGNRVNNTSTTGGDDLECPRNCTVVYSDVAGGWAGVGNLDVDPLFSDPAQGDFHLSANSPAIDAGDPAGVEPSGPAPKIDLDGDSRPQGRDVDLGADESSPLAFSTLTVDKLVALPGDILTYTITLTSTGTTEALSVRVTDTLPSLTDFVDGSLKVSEGSASYFPAGGTLASPQIIWTGLVIPGQAINVSFAVATPNMTTLYCTDLTNKARIQSDGATLERHATTRMSDALLHHIVIQDTPDSDGHPVVDRTLQPGDTLTVHAAGYDHCSGYLNPISVTWGTSGSLEQQEGWGDSFAFTPTIGGREGRITAHAESGHTAETGLITVENFPPEISLAPTFLASTQLPGERVTQTLMISNSGPSSLTYHIIATPQPFELTYTWDESAVIDTHTPTWDYFFTSEQIAPELAGGNIEITEIEIQSGGTNVADWINWDLEVHLSQKKIGLPEGQMEDSSIDPQLGYERSAPSQFLLSVGERQDSDSYVYLINHDFSTGVTSATPFYGRVKESKSSHMSISDGLHAQVGLWTGDPRVRMHFTGVQLVVRGVVTYTSHWLTVAPVSGTLSVDASQVLHAVFDADNLPANVYTTTVAIQSNDPDQATTKIPATMRVIGYQFFLPVMLKHL